ncbi:MAG: porin [Gammaproteobacteria bacterium]|nr:porin [Gammaproteobacteria bacterium]
MHSINEGETELERLIPVSIPALAALLWAGTGVTAVSSSAGLTAASADGEYTFRLGGRLMWDADSFDGVLNPASDGERRFNSQLRRARVELSGEVPGDLDWVFDVNYLDNGDTEVFAAGLRYSGWALADVFIGRDKEPFGLEEMASSKAISTMRRNFFTDATDVDSQPHYGLRLDGKAGAIGWSAGIFNPDGNPSTGDGGDRLAFTGRLFGTLLNDNGRVLHFGAAFTDRNLDEPQLEHGFRLRVAESGERLPSAAVLAREDRQAGFEALYLDGPLSLQGEYFRRESARCRQRT